MIASEASESDALVALREAFWRADARGRLARGDLASARAAVRTLEGRVPDHPAALFGAWHEMPSALQTSLRAIVERDTHAAAGLYPHGSLWTGTVLGLRLVDRHLTQRNTRGSLRRLAVSSAERVHNGPLNAWRLGQRRVARSRWARAAHPTVADALHALGADPRWLIGGFVRGASTPPFRRTFHDDARANVVHGYHLGLDLMPTPQGVYCLEVNLQAGVNWEEWPLEQRDCHAVEAVHAAEVHGARRLVWVEAQRYTIPDEIAADLARYTSEAGIALEILEDPCAPLRANSPRSARELRGAYRRLRDLPRDTLVLHRDEYLGGPDHLLSHKESSLRALDEALATLGEGAVEVLPMTREPAVDPTDRSELPNLVYKYPDSWAGRGVFFMRARDRGHALEMARALDRERGESPGLFQRFALPTRDGTGRVHDVRAEIYLTPRETRFILAMRRVAAHPFPDRMDYGLVERRGVFAANTSTGGDIVRVPANERDMIHRAAMATGDALRVALSSSFVTGPAEARPGSV